MMFVLNCPSIARRASSRRESVIASRFRWISSALCFARSCLRSSASLQICIASKIWHAFFGPFGPFGPFAPFLHIVYDVMSSILSHVLSVIRPQTDQLDQMDQKKIENVSKFCLLLSRREIRTVKPQLVLARIFRHRIDVTIRVQIPHRVR